jgi:hypothetical protein
VVSELPSSTSGEKNALTSIPGYSSQVTYFFSFSDCYKYQEKTCSLLFLIVLMGWFKQKLSWLN